MRAQLRHWNPVPVPSRGLTLSLPASGNAAHRVTLPDVEMHVVSCHGLEARLACTTFTGSDTRRPRSANAARDRLVVVAVEVSEPFTFGELAQPEPAKFPMPNSLAPRG